MNGGPISYEQLEAIRACQALTAAWAKFMEPFEMFTEKHGSPAASEDVPGCMSRETRFRRALVKAGLLQDNSNIQPLAVWSPILYPFDTLFPQKEIKNDQTEIKRSSVDLAESDEQIRNSASRDRSAARDQSNQCDTAQDQRRPQAAQPELRAGDLRGDSSRNRERPMSQQGEIRISIGETYWVLGMFKKLESICLEVNSTPMPLRPEISAFRSRLRSELKELEARKHEKQG